MQELIDIQVRMFEAMADVMRGEASDEIVKPKTTLRAGITKNKGRGQSNVRRKMAAASRRRNRAA